MKCQTLSLILAILASNYQNGEYVWNSRINEDCINGCIKNAKAVLKTEPSLLNLTGNFVVVGDIHGQLYSLLRIFDKFGYPPQTNYLFLGDYVDRGRNSLEVILLLFFLKSHYPQNIYLLRGNHEDEYVTTFYGFKAECLTKSTLSTYEKFLKAFDHLPYASVINTKYICLHGGIGPHVRNLIDISRIKKPAPIDSSEIALSIVWSDPSASAKDFKFNARGHGYVFGQGNLRKFLDENGLAAMVRAHEYFASGNATPLDACRSLFSAMRYMGEENNISVAVVGQEVEVVTFTHASDDEIRNFKPRIGGEDKEN